MSPNNLFKEFEGVSFEQWKSQIEKDLRGKEFSELITTTSDGIQIQPFYNSKANESSQEFRENNQWNIVQEILVTDDKKANSEALSHLNKGANSLLFYLNKGFNLSVLLDGILLEHISVHFVFAGKGIDVLTQLSEIAKSQGVTNDKIRGSINVDPLENLARTGDWFSSEEEDFLALNQLIQAEFKNLKNTCVNTSVFANAGASLSQQLGIALGIAYEYIHRLNITNTQGFWFGFANGSDYFGEISKLRAFRRLWGFFQRELKLPNSSAHIYSETATRNKTILDANNNMIRSTIEAMSSVIGGCDELSIKSFDITYQEESDFGKRIAKNQQSILQHESHLDAVSDISNGSYFVEILTEELCEKGWGFFKEIEEQGGYIQSLKSNWLQNQIKAVAKAEQSAFDAKTKVLIGANKYAKRDEDVKEMGNALFCREKTGNTTVEPLRVKRLSEELEKS